MPDLGTHTKPGRPLIQLPRIENWCVAAGDLERRHQALEQGRWPRPAHRRPRPLSRFQLLKTEGNDDGPIRIYPGTPASVPDRRGMEPRADPPVRQAARRRALFTARQGRARNPSAAYLRCAM